MGPFSERSSEERSSEAAKHHKTLPPPRVSLLALIERLEPRAMLAGVGPESWTTATLVTAPLGTGAISSSGPLLTCLSPTTGSSGTSSLPPSTTGSGGSPSGGVLWLPSTSGSNASKAGSTGEVDTNGPALALQYTSGSGAGQAESAGSTGSGGLMQLLYDASQSKYGGARSQPGSTGSTTSTLADAQSTTTLVPLVYQPGSDDEPTVVSTVWTGGDGGWQYFLTSDGEGSVDGGATEGEPLPLRWLGGTGYSQFRSMGGPGWGDDTPVFRPSNVEAAKRLTGLARMIADHGMPVSVRAGDSNGRVMISTFADGTSYMEPVEPPSEQYIDSAAAVLAATGVFRGGRALAIAESGGSVANPISVVFKHGSHHLTGTSLTQLEVESVIAAHVRNFGAGAGASWGWVQVEGQWILYRLHILANNVRSVGTYFPVDGPLLPK